MRRSRSTRYAAPVSAPTKRTTSRTTRRSASVRSASVVRTWAIVKRSSAPPIQLLRYGSRVAGPTQIPRSNLATFLARIRALASERRRKPHASGGRDARPGAGTPDAPLLLEEDSGDEYAQNSRRAHAEAIRAGRPGGRALGHPSATMGGHSRLVILEERSAVTAYARAFGGTACADWPARSL